MSRARWSADSLGFLPPKTIFYGTKEKSCGEIVFRLIKCLVDNGGSCEASELAKVVWGDNAPKNRLNVTCYKARGVLADLGHPQRVVVDGDMVLLL